MDFSTRDTIDGSNGIASLSSGSGIGAIASWSGGCCTLRNANVGSLPDILAVDKVVVALDLCGGNAILGSNGIARLSGTSNDISARAARSGRGGRGGGSTGRNADVGSLPDIIAVDKIVAALDLCRGDTEFGSNGIASLS